MLLSLLAMAFAIIGYTVMSRRTGHTRVHLLAGAALGGGVAGALFALTIALQGTGLADAAPFALIGLYYGAAVGVFGLLAFAVGKWLRREP
jgi:hypothetical protein